MALTGPKHVASHTIKYDVFNKNCFIILRVKHSFFEFWSPQVLEVPGNCSNNKSYCGCKVSFKTDHDAMKIAVVTWIMAFFFFAYKLKSDSFYFVIWLLYMNLPELCQYSRNCCLPQLTIFGHWWLGSNPIICYTLINLVYRRDAVGDRWICFQFDFGVTKLRTVAPYIPAVWENCRSWHWHGYQTWICRQFGRWIPVHR